MSYEVDVPISNEALTYGDLVARLEQKWALLRPNDPLNLKLTIKNATALQAAHEIQVGAKAADIELRVTENGCAGCMFWHFEHWVDDGDPESSRVQASVWAWRNLESTLMMALIASCIAEASQTLVVDESGIFARGRIIKPSTIDAALASVANLPLSMAAQTLLGTSE